MRKAACNLFIFFIYAYSQTSIASCAFTWQSSTFTLNFNLPSNLSIPRDTPNGTIIYSDDREGPTTAQFKCSTSFYSGSVDARGQKVPSGIYPIGDSGIAWQWTYNGAPRKQYPANFFSTPGSYGFTNTRLGFNLIKIGELKPGAVIPAGDLGYFYADTLRTLIISTTSMSLTAQSCQSPNEVKVDMGRPNVSQINSNDWNEWSTIGIQLTNCPEGINSMQLSFRPLASSPAIDITSGVISLNKTSTAEGVAIQIRKLNTYNLDLSKKHPIENFSPGDQNARIELQAKYIKYAPKSIVSPGTANAEIMYLIEYL